MGIISSIKSIGSKVVSGVKSIFGGGSSNAASAGMVFPLSPGASIAPKAPAATPLQIYQTKTTPLGDVSYGKNNSDVIIDGKTYYGAQSGSNTDYNNLISGGAPNVIQSRGGASGSWAPSSGLSGSPTVMGASSAMNISSNMSADSLGASSSLSSTPSGPSVSLPSSPGYTNPGLVNNAGLASEAYTHDPVTGQLVPAKQTPVATPPVDDRSPYEKFVAKFGLPPQKENILTSPEVAAQQAEVQRKQAVVNDYTSQINSIVAQQNADLLKLRDNGSKEGVTEAVYGGQEATINREAAIRALPIQAALAGAQGNLSLAQDYLTQLTQIRTEAINNEYTYKSELYKSISSYVQGEDKIKLEALNKENDRAFSAKMANTNDVHSMAASLLSTNPIASGKLLALNPDSPTYVADAQRIIQNVAPKSSGSGASSFDDIMQQAIDAGATAEQAAREAATVSENSGVPVNQETLSSWVAHAKTLKKTVNATSDTTAKFNLNGPAPKEPEPQKVNALTDQIHNFLFSPIGNVGSQSSTVAILK